jgi:hypothetical protein
MKATKRRARQYMAGDFEIKAKDEARRTFTGTLSTSHIDLGDGRARDIVHPGAFKRFLDHFKGASDRAYVPLIDGHQYRSIFNVYGHMLDGEEKLTGETLQYQRKDGGTLDVGEMLFDTEWQVIDGADGERLLDRLRPGSVRKMSMGYETLQGDEVELKDYGRARNLREVLVTEGSLVVFPMQPNADVNLATVKSLLDALRDGTLTEEMEAELRELAPEAKNRIRALLDAAPPADSDSADAPADGLAPDDPKRLQVESLIRGITIRGLARAS